MTQIHISIRKPKTGGLDPVTGTLRFRPVRRHFDAAKNLVIAASFDADLSEDGELTVDLLPTTGAFVWRAPSADTTCNGRSFCHPGYGGSLTTTNGLVLAGANDGYLRIYDADDGNVLWEADTTGDVVTVDGSTAHGGSIGGGAAAIAYKGMLIANSGYGFAGKMPGNVLLVFETKK